jgi:hypothetical protein
LAPRLVGFVARVFFEADRLELTRLALDIDTHTFRT